MVTSQVQRIVQSGIEFHGEKCRATIEYPSSEYGRADAHRKRQRPGENGAHNEQRQAIEKAFPDFIKYRLIVFPRDGLTGEKITVEIEVLNGQRFIQMKFLAKPFHHFGCEFGIQRIHLARFPGSQVNDGKRYNRDEKKRDEFLNNAATDE